MRVPTRLSSLLGKRESVHNTGCGRTAPTSPWRCVGAFAYYDNTQFKAEPAAFDSMDHLLPR